MDSAIELPNTAYLLPTPIPDWPPVWWFWLVVAGVVIVGMVVIAWLIKRHRTRHYRREALKIVTQYYQHADTDQAFIQSCLETIKRCLQTEGNDGLVSLPTSQLLPLLDANQRRVTRPLSPLSELFTQRLYQPDVELSEGEREDLYQATRSWIRKHHV